MGPVIYKVFSDISRHRRSALLLVVLLGVAGGAVLSTAAGARRTASAYPRLLDNVAASEFVISPNGSGTGTTGFYDALRDLDGVRAVGPQLGLSIIFDPDSPEGDIGVAGARGVLEEDGFGYGVDRPKLIDGRMPRPDRLDEVMVSRSVAEHGVNVGDTVQLVLVDADYFEGAPYSGGTDVLATVVGIGSMADEIVPYNELAAEPWLTVPPAMTRFAGPEHLQFEGAAIDVDPGVDLQQLRREIEVLAGEFPAELPEGLFVSDQAQQARTVQDGIRPVAVAMALFSLVVGLVSAVVLGLLLRRHVDIPPSERAALAGIGFSPRQQAQAVALRAAAIGAASAAVAVVVAIASSDRYPIGPARLAEPTPGRQIDLPVIALGALLIALLGAASTLGLQRSRPKGAHPIRIPSRMSPSATAGLRAGLGGGQGSGRMAIGAGVVGITAIVASAQFGASLDRLVSDPHRYGQQWDRVLDAQFGQVPAATLVDRFSGDDRIDALAAGTYGEVSIDGAAVASVGWMQMDGRLNPTVTEGRSVERSGELALGGEIMDRLGLSVGDEIEADAGYGPKMFAVVGEIVLPRFSLGSFITTGLGDGALLHVDDLFAPGIPIGLDDTEIPPGYLHDGRLFNFVAFDIAGDPAALDHELRQMSLDEFAFVRAEQRPTTITDLSRVRAVPSLLAMVLALLASATLAHALVVSVRRRRRELAVLRTLGLDRRQLSSTVLWQATSIVSVALVLGVPAGLVLGRFVWHSFAESLHVPPLPVTPAYVLLGIVVATVALANAVAIIPSHRAADVHPADALRAE